MVNKESLASETLKKAIKKEKIIEMVKRKEEELSKKKEKAVRLHNEVVEKLEKEDFTSLRSTLTGDHIITVILKEKQIYDRTVEEMVEKMFLEEDFFSAAYYGQKFILVLKE